MLNINYATLFFQIINFFVLVFILYKLLFKPVMAMIAQRAARIEKEVSDIDVQKKEVDALQKDYEAKLVEIESQLTTLRHDVSAEAESMRVELLQKAKAEADDILKQAEEQIHKKEDVFIQRLRKELADILIQIPSKLLKEMIDTDIQEKYILKNFQALEAIDSKEKIKYQHSFCQEKKVRIGSAVPFSLQVQKKLEKILSQILNTPVVPQYTSDPSLLAGMIVEIGDYRIDFTPKGQLIKLQDMFFKKTYLT